MKKCRGDPKYRAGRVGGAIRNGLVAGIRGRSISGHRIWIASVCITRLLICSIVCGRPVMRIVVRDSMSIRGIVAVVLAAVINSRLSDSESGGRRASEHLFCLPHTLVWAGGPSDRGRGDPHPVRWVEWVPCSSQVLALASQMSNSDWWQGWV